MPLTPPQMTEYQKRVVAVYVGGRPLGAAATGDKATMPNACRTTPAFAPFTGSEWNGWGVDGSNTRFQANPGGLTAETAPRLTLKWAFGFPFGNSAYGQPSVAADACSSAPIPASSTPSTPPPAASTGRTAPGPACAPRSTIGAGDAAHRFLAYFGDIKGNVYAVDAETGAEVWTARVDTHPVARVTGAPKLAAGRLFVPLSSLEESGAGNPSYPCCTFRGGVAAYDARTGTRIWKNFTVADEPARTKRTTVGTQLWAPAGAGVWSSPTVDLDRRAVYLATGNGYTQPADIASDAVIAYDLDTGKRLWVKQVMANDSYVRDCPGIYRPNVPKDNKSETCPDDLGPDMDFGNSPILRPRPGGRTMIVIGQKDGHAWGLDPDKQGEVMWSRQLGLGWENGGGGMMWGSAADDQLAYFPVTGNDPRLGLAAVRLGTGEIAWRGSPPAGAAAPVTVVPGVVFQGSSNGMVYAYGTADGKAAVAVRHRPRVPDGQRRQG